MLFAFFKPNGDLLDEDLIKHYNYTADNALLLMVVNTKANLSAVKQPCDTEQPLLQWKMNQVQKNAQGEWESNLTY